MLETDPINSMYMDFRRKIILLIYYTYICLIIRVQCIGNILLLWHNVASQPWEHFASEILCHTKQPLRVVFEN